MKGSLVLCFKRQKVRIGEQGFKISNFIKSEAKDDGFNTKDFRSIASEIEGIPF